MPFQTEDRTDVWSIGEIDEAWGLNRDTAITCSYCRNRECGVRDDDEDSNDLTDGVAARRDGYLFTIGVRDHFVEHEGIWPKEDVDDSDVGVPILVGVDPFECAVGGRTLDEHGVLHGLTFSLPMIRITCIDNSDNKCPQ